MILEKLQTQNSLANLHNFAKSHLSIQVSLDGFSYCVFDEDLVDVVTLKEYEFSERVQNTDKLLQYIKEIFDTEPFLKNPFESVNVTYRNNLSTLVPKAFFNETSLADYLKYTVKVLENDKISFDDIDSFQVKNVYIPYENVNRFFRQIFIDFKYKHTSTILLSSLLKYFKNTSKSYFFINVAKHQLDLIYLQNSEITLFNSFLYKTKEDFIYYILYTMEQLEIDPNDQSVTLIGDISKESPLFDILYHYVRHVNFLNINNFSLSDDFYQMNSHIQKHQLFELLNQF